MPFKQEHCRIETNEQNVTAKYPINKWNDFETKNSLTPEQTFFFFHLVLPLSLWKLSFLHLQHHWCMEDVDSPFRKQARGAENKLCISADRSHRKGHFA